MMQSVHESQDDQENAGACHYLTSKEMVLQKLTPADRPPVRR